MGFSLGGTDTVERVSPATRPANRSAADSAKLRSICVYCGSNNGAAPEFAAVAVLLGRAMARSDIRLVYGGGSIGLMGEIARSVLEHGGEVTGIIPQFLTDHEVVQRDASELIVTADMHERKRVMFERSCAFVALPGGLGTLEEVIEIMTWAQLCRHDKPILIANVNSFWDPLIAQFRLMADHGFLHKPHLGDHTELPVHFCDAYEDIIPTLEAAVGMAQCDYSYSSSNGGTFG